MTEQCEEELEIHNNKSEYFQSRIEQQSDLICILKRRADEYLEKSMLQEKQIVTLKDDYVKLKNEHEKEVEKSLAFERYLHKIKMDSKGIKLENEDLKMKNDKSSKTIDMLQQQIENGDVEIIEKRKQVVELEKLLESSSMNQRSEKASNQISAVLLYNKVNSLKQSAGQIKLVHEQIKAKYLSEVEIMLREYKLVENSFQTLSKQYKVSVEETKSLEKKIEQLENKLMLLKKKEMENQNKLSEFEGKIAATSEKLQKNELVQTLKSRVFELEDELTYHVVHFDAYKSHSSDLLKRERDINAQLRRLKKTKSETMQEEKKLPNNISP